MDELIRECEKAYDKKNFSRLDWFCNEILEQQKINETALTYKLLRLAPISFGFQNCR